jgi:diaminohydroxyphosphoribosylaminopyrimidine deaminase/5-amino-6-(5-phosphoribosylamino)uracil reductase
MVGAKTAAHDNPQLNVRDWTGRNPVRIVIDRFLKLDDTLNVFDKKQKTILYNLIKHEEHPNLSLVRIDEENFFEHLIKDLYKRNIQSVIIEGGATLLNFFLALGLWDEARVFKSSRSFNKGIPAPALHGRLIKSYPIESDTLSIFVPRADLHSA